MFIRGIYDGKSYRSTFEQFSLADIAQYQSQQAASGNIAREWEIFQGR